MMLTGGHRTAAGPEAEIALRRAREIRNPTCLALALFTRAWAEWEDQPEAALAAVEESIALSRAGAVDGALGTSLSVAARIRVRLGDLAGAWAAMREAILYSRDVGDTANLGFALFEMADALGARDEPFVAELGGALKDGAFRQLLLQTGGEELTRREEAITRVRETLDPSDFDPAWARGAAMTHDEVIDFALAKLDELLLAAEER